MRMRYNMVSCISDPSTTATSPTVPPRLGASYPSTLSYFQRSTSATRPLLSRTMPHAVNTTFSHRPTIRTVNTRTDTSRAGSYGTMKRETDHTTIESRKDTTKSSLAAVTTKKPPISGKKACFVPAHRRILRRGKTSMSVRTCSPVTLANVDWPKTAGGMEARMPCRSGNGTALRLCYNTL